MEDPDGRESNMGAIRGLRGALGTTRGTGRQSDGPQQAPSCRGEGQQGAGRRPSFHVSLQLAFGGSRPLSPKVPLPTSQSPKGTNVLPHCFQPRWPESSPAQEVSFQLGSIVAPHRPRRTAPGMSLPTPCPRAAMQCYFGSGGRAWPPRVVRVLASW